MAKEKKKQKKMDMQAMIYFFEGTASADGKTITQKCSYDDPVRGSMVWRSVTRVVDDNTLEYECSLPRRGARKKG
jgi:hypothetical protein